MNDTTWTDCPLEYAAYVISGKWKIRILWFLSQTDSIRFNALKKKLNGITDLMLTKNLKELMAAGVVTRVQYNEVPPKVEYSLTENGLRLIDALIPIANWSKETITTFHNL